MRSKHEANRCEGLRGVEKVIKKVLKSITVDLDADIYYTRMCTCMRFVDGTIPGIDLKAPGMCRCTCIYLSDA